MAEQVQTLDDALREALSSGGEEQHAETAAEPTETVAEAPTDEVAPPPAEPTKATPPETAQPAAKKGPVAPVKPAPATPGAAAKPVEGASPKTWAPAVREHWNALPRPVRDQILKREGDFIRREAEFHRTLTEARKGASAYEEALKPFEPHLKASGVEPIAAVKSLLQTEYTLRTGTPAQRAQVVARVISGFGVDPAAVAAALEGQPIPETQQAPQQFRDPRLDQLLGQLQQRQQSVQAEHRAQAAQQLEEFRGKAEFLEDVRGKMASLMKAAREDGQPMTLQQAYDEACYLVPSVRTVLDQRKAEEAARARTQQAQQARHAASSVKTQPSPPDGARKPSMDDYLLEQLRGSRR